MKELSKTAQQVHSSLAVEEGVVQINYAPSCARDGGSHEDISAQFDMELSSLQEREIAAGMSLIGPHRDDIVIKEDDVDMTVFSSRGQARTLAMSLRLSEAELLAKERGDQPIILLDDVFSELDGLRRNRLIRMISQYQQTVLTVTEPSLLGGSHLGQAIFYQVSGGAIWGPE